MAANSTAVTAALNASFSFAYGSFAVGVEAAARHTNGEIAVASAPSTGRVEVFDLTELHSDSTLTCVESLPSRLGGFDVSRQSSRFADECQIMRFGSVGAGRGRAVAGLELRYPSD